MPFTVIAAGIDKQRQVNRYADPANPYAIALTFCMERLQHWLREQGQENKKTHVVVECRGRTEGAKLELEFRPMLQVKPPATTGDQMTAYPRS